MQACSLKMAGYWPLLFASFWTSIPTVSANYTVTHTDTKKNLGCYPAMISRLINIPHILLNGDW